MINSVRNTVLAVANKENYGYITPSDFNLYAKQAQLDIFEEYFYRYNEWITKQNARVSGSDYANVVKNLEEVIDKFSSVSGGLTYSVDRFELPSDYYLINKVLYSGNKEIERVSHGKVTNLLSSSLTTPTTAFPAYTMIADNIQVYPDSIVSNVTCHYIRRPKDPKWTYVSMAGGEPLFDSSAPDFQDFELPATDEPLLVNKILQYVGISLREGDLYKSAQQDEMIEKQKQG